MNIYTVCFLGHRYIERGAETENRLDKLLHDLITQKKYVDFLIGRDGDFDLLASAAFKAIPRRAGMRRQAAIRAPVVRRALYGVAYNILRQN